MKYKIIFILLLFTCCAKSKNQVSQPEEFDIENFDKYKVGNSMVLHENDTIYYLMENAKTYKKVWGREDENLKYQKIYDKKTLKLLSETTYFSNAFIGYLYQYNTNGKLIKEVNLDEKYPFSIKDLINKIRIEYNIDLLLENDSITINKYEDKHPVYDIVTDVNDKTIRLIRVSGVTGSLIKDTIVYKKE